MWNRMEYRPLEGFVFAVSPFNFTAIASNMERYRNYPRIVGETGGKDFIVAHPSADVDAVATAIVRGSFEYQGQKCSAASRVFVSSNLWPELRERLVDQVGSLSMGDVSDFGNFMGAVIDGGSFQTQKQAIDEEYAETLDLADRGAPYGLTGAVFARDRSAIETAEEKLRYAAGNFYVNDKPTGAVVGQQPFGGARASGTNDKAGSMWNL